MKSAKAVQLATIFLTACLLPMLGCQKADPAKIFEYTNKNDSGGLQNELRKGIDAAGIERISKSYELTPLHIAANAGNLEIAQALVKAGFDVNVKSAKDGVTPLFFAASSGQDEMVSFLLAKGADVNFGLVDYGSLTPMGTPLMAAAQFGHTKTVALLLKSAPDKDQGRATALEYAAMAGQLDVVKLLMEDPEANKGSAAAAELAVANGRRDVVKYLQDNDLAARAVIKALKHQTK